MSQESLVIQEYSKNPVNNYEMEVFSVSQTQGNTICGDDVVVFLSIDNGVVTKYSYAGNPSTITSAAASLLADLIEWVKLEDILNWTQQRLIDEGFVVSHRRRRSSVSALLAVRNAIHKYLGDGLEDDYDDVIV